MSKFYSKTTNGFYDSNVNASMPSDVVPVTDINYASLMAAQAAGQVIQGDSNGNPEAVAPTYTSAQLALQAANTAIAGGIQIISTSTSNLNGTYSVNAYAIANINAIATYILRNNSFPNGASSMPWMDAGGTPHVFPSTAEFDDFATAVGNFVKPISPPLSAVTLYADSGGEIGSIPSQPVTIA